MSKYFLILLGIISMSGCVQVDSGSDTGVELCTGTECGDGHNTDDHTDSSTTDVAD